MATYTNSTPGSSLDDALGNPTLGGTDIVVLNDEGDNYTASLTALGSTAIAEFYMNPPFMGDLGVGQSGVQVQAGDMVLNGSSPRSVALKGVGSGTVTYFHWNMVSNAAGWLDDYTITKLSVDSGGMLTILDSTVVTSAYMGGRGNHLFFESGTALTNLFVGGTQNQATLHRDCANVECYGGRVLCADAAATPTSMKIFAGYANHLGGTVTIEAGAGAVIDLSQATSDFTITWIIKGDVTIIEPPSDISWSEPSASEILAGKVTLKKAA